MMNHVNTDDHMLKKAIIKKIFEEVRARLGEIKEERKNILKDNEGESRK